MTNEQILKQAIEKVIKNGWKPMKVKDNERLEFDIHSESVSFYTEKKYSRKAKKWSMSIKTVHSLSIKDILFDHDFAKAFFGKGVIRINDGYCEGATETKKGWQYYLQQMVLKKEPLQYLKQFLKQA